MKFLRRDLITVRRIDTVYSVRRRNNDGLNAGPSEVSNNGEVKGKIDVYYDVVEALSDRLDWELGRARFEMVRRDQAMKSAETGPRWDIWHQMGRTEMLAYLAGDPEIGFPGLMPRELWWMD